MKDYYYILGVKPEATTKEIQKAYRKLSIKFHPDKNDGDKFFEERFKEIQEAWEVLRDEDKRKRYNLKRGIKSNFYDDFFKENDFHKSHEEKTQKQHKSAPPLPIIVKFESDPKFIHVGESVSISWSVRNASDIRLSGFSTPLSATGSKTIKIKSFKTGGSVTFKITAKNAEEKVVSRDLIIFKKKVEKSKESDKSEDWRSNYKGFSEKESESTTNEESSSKSSAGSNREGRRRVFLTILGIIVLLLYFTFWKDFKRAYLEHRAKERVEQIIKSNNDQRSNDSVSVPNNDKSVNNRFIGIDVNKFKRLIDTKSIPKEFNSNDLEPIMTIDDLLTRLSGYSHGDDRDYEIVTLENDYYIFSQYFTGGAHCCTVLMVFKANSDSGPLSYFGSFTRDGPAGEMGGYPIQTGVSFNYFYSSYASRQSSPQFPDCRTYLYVANDRLLLKAEGSFLEYLKIFKKTFEVVAITTLVNGQDQGERKLMLDMLNEMFLLGADFDLLSSIYWQLTPEFPDKQSLWPEIKSEIKRVGDVYYDVSESRKNRARIDFEKFKLAQKKESQARNQPISLVNDQKIKEIEPEILKKPITGNAVFSSCYKSSPKCSSNCSILNVIAPEDSDMMVFVKRNNNIDYHAFISRGESYSFDVENDKYEVFFYLGDNWQKEKYFWLADCGSIFGDFDDPVSLVKTKTSRLKSEIVDFVFASGKPVGFSVRGAEKRDIVK